MRMLASTAVLLESVAIAEEQRRWKARFRVIEGGKGQGSGSTRRAGSE
jgi:hypothetical protein